LVPLALHDLAQVTPESGDRLRRPPVRAHAKGIGPLLLQEVGALPELVGDELIG